MPIDIITEEILSLTQAAKTLPPGRAGRPVSMSCMLRWVLEGVRLPSGERVRLEAIRLGGRWLTSKEALQRFADAQTPQLIDPVAAGLVAVSNEKTARRSERAAAE